MKHLIFGKAFASASGSTFRYMLTPILLAASLVLGSISSSMAHDSSVVVMTRNLYQGTDFDALLVATPATFATEAAQALLNIRASRPAERAAAVAREIVRNRVDLVGIQEATIVRTGPIQPFPPNASFLPATNVESDGLQLLLAALRRLGEPYEVVAIVPGLDAEIPTGLGIDARLTVSDAIIARSRSKLELSNIQVQGFLVDRTFTALGGAVQIPNPRGWASVDVEVDGRKFRFATAHLETEDFLPQPLQAYDMIHGAGATNLPLVFVGDFNVIDTTASDPTYGLFLNAGFADAWSRKRPTDPGLTCCQDADLLNPTSLFDRRIDLVLFRGAFHVEDIRLVGERPGDRILPPPRLWPSDHAGVVATLRIPRGH